MGMGGGKPLLKNVGALTESSVSLVLFHKRPMARMTAYTSTKQSAIASSIALQFDTQ
jgi:hypothetical protein